MINQAIKRFRLGSRSVGIGFRFEISDWIEEHIHEFDVLELTVDHYLNARPYQKDLLQELAKQIPFAFHGVGLSIGTSRLPEKKYLKEVARCIEIFNTPWYSEHLAFTKVPGRDLSQLLPLPRTKDTAREVMKNINFVKAAIPVPLVLENITYYYDYPVSEMTENQFLELVLGETGTFLLLDIENVFLNSQNHGFDPFSFVDSLPAGIVKAMHMAGGERTKDLLLDTHNQPVPLDAFRVYEHALKRYNPDVIILERDDRLEQSGEILYDVCKLKQIACTILAPESR